MTNSIDLYSAFGLEEALQRLPKQIKNELQEHAATHNITIESIYNKYKKHIPNFGRGWNFYKLFYDFVPFYYRRDSASQLHFNNLKKYLRSPIQTIMQIEVVDFPTLKPKMSLRDWYCRNDRYKKVINMFNKKGIFPDEDDLIITIL